MQNPKHGQQRPHHFQPKSAKGLGSDKTVFVVGGAIAAVALLISQLPSASQKAGSQRNATNLAPQAIATALATDTIPPVQALSAAAVRKGVRHLGLAMSEGLPGEMIYSQNCYDALTRHFTWAKLDICGAFDIAAANELGDNEAKAFEAEIAWFQSEAAAGRYLKAATAAGELADEADTRLDTLQTRVAKVRPTEQAATATQPSATTVGMPNSEPAESVQGVAMDAE